MNEEDCTHDQVHKEYMGGFDTGDYVCDQCRKEFSSRSSAESASAEAHIRLAAKKAARDPSIEPPQI